MIQCVVSPAADVGCHCGEGEGLVVAKSAIEETLARAPREVAEEMPAPLDLTGSWMRVRHSGSVLVVWVKAWNALNISWSWNSAIALDTEGCAVRRA